MSTLAYHPVVRRLLRCAAASCVALLACGPRAGDEALVAAAAPPPPPRPPKVLIHERDAAVPPGFPLPLPDLAEVLEGQHLVTEAGLTTTTWSLSARTHSEDIEDVREALEGELASLGFEFSSFTVPGGQGRSTTLEAHDPDCSVEVGAMLHHDTLPDHPPGVSLVLTWTEVR